MKTSKCLKLISNFGVIQEAIQLDGEILFGLLKKVSPPIYKLLVRKLFCPKMVDLVQKSRLGNLNFLEITIFIPKILFKKKISIVEKVKKFNIFGKLTITHH